MPQIAYTTNVKPLDGTSSHYELITQQMSCKKQSSYGDLVIVPTTGSKIITHQAVLAAVSPFLASLFRQFASGSVRETVTVMINMNHDTLLDILDIVHTGTIIVKNEDDSNRVKAGLDMMGISIRIEIVKSNQGNRILSSPQDSNCTLPSLKKTDKKRKMSTKTPGSVKRPKVTTSKTIIDRKSQQPMMFECNECNLEFKLRRGLNSHMSKSHSTPTRFKLSITDNDDQDDLHGERIPHSKQREITSFFSPKLSKPCQLGYQVSTSGEVSSFPCCKCDKFFLSQSILHQHLACVHFAKQLLQVYPDQACPFSSCQHTAQNNLVKLGHIALHHQPSLSVLLEKEGLPSLSIVPVDNLYSSECPAFLTPSCQLCPHTTTSSQALAAHYMTQHYASNLDTWDTSPCQVCGALFFKGSAAGRQRMLQHVALRHAGMVVQFMERDGLWVGRGEVFREGESVFRIKNIRVNMKKLNKNKPSIVKKLSEIKLKPKQFKRSTKSKNTSTRKENIVKAPAKKADYDLDFTQADVTTPDLSCFLCGTDFSQDSMDGLLEHMSTTHYRLELERTYMTKSDTKWALSNHCPVCDKKVDDWETFVKHIGVQHRAVEQFMPEKFRFPPETAVIKTEESSHTCMLSGCTRQFMNERTLLVHMVMSHYYKRLELMFEQKFLEDNSRCFKCGKSLPCNKVGFMKHMGVDHAVVMDLVRGTFELDKFIAPNMKKEQNI